MTSKYRSRLRIDLDSIGTAIASLTADDAHTTDGSSSALLVNHLNTCLEELHSASVSSADAAGAVARLAGILCGNLQAVRGHSGIGNLFAETVERCCEALDGVASRAQPMWPFHASPAEEAPEQLYTMQSERDVHQAEMGVIASQSAGAFSESTAEVEFF